MVKKGWFLLGTILEVPYPLQMTMTTDNHRRDLQQTNDAPEKHFLSMPYARSLAKFVLRTASSWLQVVTGQVSKRTFEK